MNRLLLAPLAVTVLLSACATVRPTSALPIGVRLNLAAVDGKRIDGPGFTLLLRNDGGYDAIYDCGDHFGTYAYAQQLTLRPGATTGKSCDQIDLSTGKRIVHDFDSVRDFFADPNFAVAASARSVDLRNSRHMFRFVTQP